MRIKVTLCKVLQGAVDEIPTGAMKCLIHRMNWPKNSRNTLKK
jgi:hypothetical protein